MTEIALVQSYWDSRPCNIRHGTAPVGTKAYFDQVEARKYMVEPHIPRFAQFDRWKGKRVLEIGCGIGTDAVNFARAGANYTAIELSPNSLALARQRFKVFGLHGTFHLGSAEELDSILPAQIFDLVYSFGVIHHTPNAAKVTKCVQRYLGPRSLFRLMLYAKNSWKNAMIAHGFDQPEAQTGCPIANTYSEAEVRELLSGYEVTSYQQDHVFPYIVEKYVKHEYELQPWITAMPKAEFRAMEQSFGWHGLIEARLPT